MKAYVIKNKEGKYLGVARNYSHYWADDIFHSYHFMPISESHDIETEVKEYRDTNYPDCEVVEITIAEGDFEEENRVLKKALELACEEVAEYECDNYNQNGYGTIRTNHFEYFIQQAKESKKYE